MPVQHKHSKDPGDNKEMMQSRREFLEEGAYNPLRIKVAEFVAKFLPKNTPTLLDIGCGEGFYTAYIHEHTAKEHTNLQTYGLDISKIAIRYAAKRYKNCHFSVASSHRLPFADHSLGAIIRIYAPCKAEELERCVADQGIIITVTPAARHLFQFKELIYQDVRHHDEHPETIPGFSLIHQEKLHYPMSLSGNSAFHLLQMTPFAWRASEAVKQTVKHASQFSCEADFMIRVFRKDQ